MRSLGRLVRGLSALFWGLPITLIICVQTITSEWIRSLGPYGLFVPVAANTLLYYGLWLMGDFQKQERIWMLALDRAKLLCLVNVGLAPFLIWHQQLPGVPFFSYAVSLMSLSALLFLSNLNQMLHRLTAMLPDETLRTETKIFTALNGLLIFLIPASLALYYTLLQIQHLPYSINLLLQMLEPTYSEWLIAFLILLPMAITMSLIWKIKEVILASVFGPEH